MNVKDLCLGALTFGDASGYDLKKFFATTFNQFCTAGFGSIYPALAELASEGLVCAADDAQTGRPDRKLYHLTTAGRQAFIASLLRATPSHRVKSDFLLVMYFGHLLPSRHLEAFLDGRIAELERQIGILEHYRSSVKTAKTSSQAVRGYGLSVMTAARDYLRHHRDEIVATASAARPRAQQHTGASAHTGARPV